MPAPSNHVPNIRSLCAHIGTLGLSDGDPLPHASALAEATGIPRRGVFKVLADLKDRGAISDHETPGHPPRVRLLDLIAEIGTAEGYARHVASAKEPGTDTPKAGSAGAWAEVMARVDTLSADLSVALEDIAASASALSALPQMMASLPGLVEAAVRRVLSEAPLASGATPRAVRQKSQTHAPKIQTPSEDIASMTAKVIDVEGGEEGAAAALSCTPACVRRMAEGSRRWPGVVVRLLAYHQRLAEGSKNE